MITGSKKGFAILTVIFIMTMFAILGIAAVSMISGASQVMVDEYNSQQALEIADAGVEYSRMMLEADSNWADNADFSKNLSPGQFTITYVSKSTNTATIRSDGTVNGLTRSLQTSLSRRVVAFTNAMYTDQNIEIGNNPTGVINGDLSAGGTITPDSHVIFNGDVNPNDPTVATPSADWAYWQSVANHVITGDFTFDQGTVYTGIYYVTGKVTFKGGVINGSVITQGSATMGTSKSLVINPTGSNPAIIAGGDIRFEGSSDVAINGWVLSMQDVVMTGTSDVVVNGGVAAKSDIMLQGNTNVVVNYVSPGDTIAGLSGGQQIVITSALQETF